MTQEYSDPVRAAEQHALPDLEVFYLSSTDIISDHWVDPESERIKPGYYWWPCFPGCLPDGEPIGPFTNYNEALANARE